MKKVLLALAAVVLMGAATAQNVNKQALLQKIEQNQAATADAKKNTKAATWVNLAKSYIDAAVEPTKDLYVGELVLMLQPLGAPKSSEETTLQGQPVARYTYDYMTVYTNETEVLGWQQTAHVQPDAIQKALEALNKAYQVEPKKASAIQTQLKRISDFSAQAGNALYNIGQYAAASGQFETAHLAESHPAFGTPDLSHLYNAGKVAVVGGAEDPALFARGEEFLTRAHAQGYEGGNDEFYYLLYHAYYGQRETSPAKLPLAKATLLEGREKYPDNERLLESLIGLYTTTEGLGDPRDLVTDLDEKIAADPTNLNHWFNRAQIFVKLENYDEAKASLDKAIAVDPNSYTAQFFAGYYLIAKADALNAVANEKNYTSMTESDADQQEILSTYAEAVPYLENAHRIDQTQYNPVLLLKTLTFRLRDQEGMQKKFEHYDALEKLMANK